MIFARNGNSCRQNSAIFDPIAVTFWQQNRLPAAWTEAFMQQFNSK
jgi:hypothetical protein